MESLVYVGLFFNGLLMNFIYFSFAPVFYTLPYFKLFLRLLSGMSDAFDELFGSSTPLLSPTDPLSSLSFTDLLGVYDDRTTGLDEQTLEFRHQNPPQTFCSNCGCHCVLYGIKWRYAFVLHSWVNAVLKEPAKYSNNCDQC